MAPTITDGPRLSYMVIHIHTYIVTNLRGHKHDMHTSPVVLQLLQLVIQFCRGDYARWLRRRDHSAGFH